jgi:hypothetical protein
VSSSVAVSSSSLSQPDASAIQSDLGVSPPLPVSADSELPALPSIALGSEDNSVLPDWALHYVAASLRIGLLVPDIERRLVARGLYPAAARLAVNRVLESLVTAQSERATARERIAWIHRVLSLLFASMGIAVAYCFSGGPSAGKTLIYVLGSLACIWFPEVMGRSSDPYRAACLVWFGWAALLVISGLPIAFFIFAILMMT